MRSFSLLVFSHLQPSRSCARSLFSLRLYVYLEWSSGTNEGHGAPPSPKELCYLCELSQVSWSCRAGMWVPHTLSCVPHLPSAFHPDSPLTPFRGSLVSLSSSAHLPSPKHRWLLRLKENKVLTLATEQELKSILCSESAGEVCLRITSEYRPIIQAIDSEVKQTPESIELINNT